MTHLSSTQQYLDYVHHTLTPESKVSVLEKHYDTINREMQRSGTWKEHARLLDVGCGHGLYSEFWHSRGMHVTGIDFDASHIAYASERARAHNWSIRYETGSADRLPFADRSFDIVYANSLLEHVEDWECCLTDWIRVLAPGGLLWVETTNILCPRQGEFRWLPFYRWWPGLLKGIAVRLARGPLPALANYTPCPALHWFSFFQLEKFLSDRGLSVRDRFDCLDVDKVGRAKRLVRNLAVSNRLARRAAYLLLSPLVVLATRPTASMSECSLVKS